MLQVLHFIFKNRILKRNFHDLEGYADTSWQLRGLNGNDWVYVAVTGSYMTLTGTLPRSPHNSHVDPVITTQTPVTARR